MAIHSLTGLRDQAPTNQVDPMLEGHSFPSVERRQKRIHIHGKNRAALRGLSPPAKVARSVPCADTQRRPSELPPRRRSDP